MQKLTLIYKEVEPGIFNATVMQYPKILAYKWRGIDLCRDTMYHLIFEELKGDKYEFNKEWAISKEIIIYYNNKG